MIPQIKKILYATGLGPGAPFVFRYALSLACAYQAKIVVVNAIEPLSTFGQNLLEAYISQELSEQIHDEACRTVKKNLLDRVKRLVDKESDSIPDGLSYIREIAVLEGRADKVILEKAADDGADMIVMGCQSQTAFERAILGSTARRVSRDATIPVCLIRIPEGYREEGF